MVVPGNIGDDMKTSPYKKPKKELADRYSKTENILARKMYFISMMIFRRNPYEIMNFHEFLNLQTLATSLIPLLPM